MLSLDVDHRELSSVRWRSPAGVRHRSGAGLARSGTKAVPLVLPRIWDCHRFPSVISIRG